MLADWKWEGMCIDNFRKVLKCYNMGMPQNHYANEKRPVTKTHSAHFVYDRSDLRQKR